MVVYCILNFQIKFQGRGRRIGRENNELRSLGVYRMYTMGIIYRIKLYFY